MAAVIGSESFAGMLARKHQETRPFDLHAAYVGSTVVVPFPVVSTVVPPSENRVSLATRLSKAFCAR
ncbi:hypothetical protein, partial [Mesorhizobium sp.]|uniref:hypothetical protein n=1 Tax=Mesorhizobium sp. TaxID=1871066 RepID=UPI0025C4B2BD